MVLFLSVAYVFNLYLLFLFNIIIGTSNIFHNHYKRDHLIFSVDDKKRSTEHK